MMNSTIEISSDLLRSEGSFSFIGDSRYCFSNFDINPISSYLIFPQVNLENKHYYMGSLFIPYVSVYPTTSPIDSSTLRISMKIARLLGRLLLWRNW